MVELVEYHPGTVMTKALKNGVSSGLRRFFLL